MTTTAIRAVEATAVRFARGFAAAMVENGTPCDLALGTRSLNAGYFYVLDRLLTVYPDMKAEVPTGCTHAASLVELARKYPDAAVAVAAMINDEMDAGQARTDRDGSTREYGIFSTTRGLLTRYYYSRDAAEGRAESFREDGSFAFVAEMPAQG